MAANVYATMARNLAIVRRRLNRPLTLADKLVLGHLADPEQQELAAGHSYLLLRPDRVVLQDVLGQTGMLQFMQTGRARVAVPTTMNLIASPEIVTALALAGRLSFNLLTDTLRDAAGQSFKLQPPQPAPEVPVLPFVSGRSTYVAPPEDGRHVVVQVNPQRERLQVMTPWPAWDGQDFLAMPVLMKTRGKTTTDHISPAGVWLRYRGHLDKFSENLLSGAINAFSSEAGKGQNVLTGERGLPIATIARFYKAQEIKWVIIGDHNYGEGSSREHAALSLRLLGGVAVIARSFARIHESNLKKQGLLALTFQQPSDYERIQENDRISLIGLAAIQPGKSVTCLVRHTDGTTETVLLAHSFSAAQLAWFRAGSALQLLRAPS